MKQKIAVLASVVLFVSGCASLQKPDEAELAALPLVEFGDQVPADGRYILHFPKGVAIDTPVTFGGDLFQKDDMKTLSVAPRQDIYVHKQWVSFDRKHWQPGDAAMVLDLKLKLPGYEHPKPGYLNLYLDKKE